MSLAFALKVRCVGDAQTQVKTATIYTHFDKIKNITCSLEYLSIVGVMDEEAIGLPTI